MSAASVKATERITDCPYTINSSGTYLLGNNVVSNESACIKISASDVMFDCQGYSITGDGNNSAILAHNRQNISIENCIVQNFSFGILLNSTNQSLLIDNTANNNGIGFSVAGSKNTLNGNTIIENYIGINFWLVNNTNITNNNIINNTLYGAYLSDSEYNTFWNNTFTNNNLNAYEESDANNNNWNTTIGNYWDDFRLNPGYANGYEIYGPGDGIDSNPNPYDKDTDGILDDADNCLMVPNPGQSDSDRDGIGDVCDNCPDDYNPNQNDSDQECNAVCRDKPDYLGDLCDNCLDIYNPRQQDINSDGEGDKCEVDENPPEIDISIEPEDPSPTDMVNIRVSVYDPDGILLIDIIVNNEVVASCDESPCNYYGGPYIDGLVYFVDFADQQGNVMQTEPTPCATIKDIDGDGIGDFMDNCIITPNHDQTDLDADGVGDICDNCPPTFNWTECAQIGITHSCNICWNYYDAFCKYCCQYITANPQPPYPQADSDSDGVGDVCDLCEGTQSGLPVNELGCPSCQDSDGTNVYNKGYIIVPMGSFSVVYYDECVNDHTVKEYYCASQQKQDLTYNCGIDAYICSDGRCCMDSDGDTVCDDEDNCVNIANTNQADVDNDGEGDYCDCNDEIKSGYEFGIDCGGNCPIMDCCTNGYEDASEDGIDCGGNCPAECVDCFADAGYGSAAYAGYFCLEFSFICPNFQVVQNTAAQALQEYANEINVMVHTLDTPDEYMEAVGWYVANHTEWTADDENYGILPAAFMITSTSGRCSLDYCGDCEDHAILRGALLRTLGVSWKCAFCADHYDNNCPKNDKGKKGGAHAFNIVLYKGKYRIMDYNDLGTHFNTPTWCAHNPINNIWSDRFGEHWCKGQSSEDCTETPPSTYTHNYPGNPSCPSSYAHETYYSDVCP